PSAEDASRSGSGSKAGTGSRTVKVEPWPSPALSASTSPPCSSTKCRTMANPSPSPPCSRVLLPSACQNRSKRCGSASTRMP
ncbi:hypothetical protein STIAU_1825, partial [Stigmatella aurantiaca DW4/3-1]